jgi:uncharacterized membrane protein YagU involved in acid resistance
METKIQKAVLGGIVATAVMTMIIFMAPLMGIPKMNPAEMLAGKLGGEIIIGWVMHFMIGVIFALVYVFLFSELIRKINSKVLKGALFGLSVFVFAQIMMVLMNFVTGGNESPAGNMFLILLGSVMGHINYGIVVALFLPNRA